MAEKKQEYIERIDELLKETDDIELLALILQIIVKAGGNNE